MVVAYLPNRQAHLLAAIRAAHPAIKVVARNPRYWQGPEHVEPAATQVLLVGTYPAIQAAYEARGVPVRQWGDAPPATYTVHHRGYGWYDVLGANGVAVNEAPLRKAEAEARCAQLGGTP